MGKFRLIAIFLTIILIAIAVLPSGVVRRIEFTATILPGGGMAPEIGYVSWKARTFTFAEWVVHEQEKAQIISGDHNLRAVVCDPPSDCDADSETFDWHGDPITIRLLVPTFIGNRVGILRLMADGELLDEEVVEVSF